MDSAASFVFLADADLALRVRLERVRRRWRQKDLADAAGVSAYDVSNLECGKAVFTERVQRIFAALNLDGNEGRT